MKKILVLALLSVFYAVTAPTSCEQILTDYTIFGTWQMRYDDSHYFDATFNTDGTYEWLWQGAQGLRKDAGKFKLDGTAIIMTPEKYWTEEWATGGLLECSQEDFGWSGPRKVTILELHNVMAYWKWEGSNLFDSSKESFGADAIPVFRKGAKDFQFADLQGTWKGKQLLCDIALYVFNGNEVTLYSIDEPTASTPLRVDKAKGTCTLENNELTIHFTQKQSTHKYLGDGKHQYYEVDPATYEAKQWNTATVDYSEVYTICIYNDQLFMESEVFTKQP